MKERKKRNQLWWWDGKIIYQTFPTTWFLFFEHSFLAATTTYVSVNNLFLSCSVCSCWLGWLNWRPPVIVTGQLVNWSVWWSSLAECDVTWHCLLFCFSTRPTTNTPLSSINQFAKMESIRWHFSLLGWGVCLRMTRRWVLHSSYPSNLELLASQQLEFELNHGRLKVCCLPAISKSNHQIPDVS